MKNIGTKKFGMKKIITKTTFISRTPIAALLILLNISATPAYAAVAGRVLVSVGDSVAIRNGQEVRLRFGSQIEDKDTLRTGAAGTLQVRFTDQSIVALREKSTFKLEQYAYAKEKGGTQTAIFNLIKGGFRTITGLIGKSNQKSYSVKTAAATIGIRGTHYAVRVCEDDCKNPDGSNAKDGVYGSVLSASDKDSRIVINNLSGENEFSRDEHFYVKDEKSSPEMLLVPPSFVADNLKGRGQVANGKSGKDDEGRNEKAGREAGEDQGRDNAKGGSDHDPRPNMISRTFESKVTVNDPNCTTGDCRNLPPPPLQRGSVEVTGKVGHIAGLLTGGSFSTGLISKNDELPLKPTGELVRVEQEGVAQQRILDIGLAGNFGTGRHAIAGNLAWGAWIGNGITDQSTSINGTFTNPLDSFVYLYGDAAPVLPNNLVGIYKPIGGIAVDRAGQTGKITEITGGDISVDFLKQLVSLNNLTVGMSNRSFTYNTITPVAITAGAFSDFGTATCTSGTITCATSYVFNSSGIFTGAFAQGIGLHYSLDGGAADQIIGVEGFLREPTATQTFRPVINASNFGVAGGLATTIVSGLGATEKLLSFTADPTAGGGILASGVETNLLSFTAVTDMVGGLAAINAHWGRWVNGALNIDGFLTAGTGVHYIYGFDLTTPSVVAARHGIFNFTHLAGTTPTDDLGLIAGVSSFGSMFVNFQTNDGVMSPMNWTINGTTHNINSVDITLAPDAQRGVVIINGTSIDGTCSGGAACPNGGAASTQVTGAFAGANGNYAALSIATQSIAGSTASAQIYSCANCGSTAGITPAGAVVAYAGGTGLTTFANTDNPLFILPTDKTLDSAGNLIAYNTLFQDSATHLNVDSVSTLTNNVVSDGTVGPAGDGYGRWSGGQITGNILANPNLPATPFTPASGIHVAYSAALTLPEVIAARTGTFNFNHTGGTLPTDHLGNVGTFGGGNLNVNFNQPQTASMNANWNVGGVAYTLTATPLTLSVDGAGAHIGAFLPNDVTATCSACSPIINQVATIDQLNIQGNFSGLAGNTINMAISTFDAGVGATAPVPVTSASVQVFQEGALPVLALQRGALP